MVPNLVPKKKEKDGLIEYGGNIADEERVVKGENTVRVRTWGRHRRRGVVSVTVRQV